MKDRIGDIIKLDIFLMLCIMFLRHINMVEFQYFKETYQETSLRRTGREEQQKQQQYYPNKCIFRKNKLNFLFEYYQVYFYRNIGKFYL